MDEDARFFEQFRRVLDDLEFPDQPDAEPGAVRPVRARRSRRAARRTHWLTTPLTAVLVVLISVFLGRWRPVR
jgi:hypothetical protein